MVVYQSDQEPEGGSNSIEKGSRKDANTNHRKWIFSEQGCNRKSEPTKSTVHGIKATGKQDTQQQFNRCKTGRRSWRLLERMKRYARSQLNRRSQSTGGGSGGQFSLFASRPRSAEGGVRVSIVQSGKRRRSAGDFSEPQEDKIPCEAPRQGREMEWLTGSFE